MRNLNIKRFGYLVPAVVLTMLIFLVAIALLWIYETAQQNAEVPIQIMLFILLFCVSLVEFTIKKSVPMLAMVLLTVFLAFSVNRGYANAYEGSSIKAELPNEFTQAADQSGCQLNGKVAQLGEIINLQSEDGLRVTVQCRVPTQVNYMGNKEWAVTATKPQWVLFPEMVSEKVLPK